MLICSAPNKPFANGKQRIWHSQRAKRMLSRADQQQGSDQDDAAYLEKLLGDSAGRTPKQLSVSTKADLFSGLHDFLPVSQCELPWSDIRPILPCFDDAGMEEVHHSVTPTMCEVVGQCGLAECRQKHRSTYSCYGQRAIACNLCRTGLRLATPAMALLVTHMLNRAALLRAVIAQYQVKLQLMVQLRGCPQRRN